MTTRSDALAQLDVSRLSRARTAEHVAGLLRDAVLDGTLAPGAPLRELALTKRLKVSRSTLREAIQLLVHDGLAVHQLHRGAMVVQLTPIDLVDIYRARRALELAAADSVEHVDAQALRRLEGTMDAMAGAAESGDWQAVFEVDLELHRAIVALLGSTRIDQFHGLLQGELRLAMLAVDRSTRDLDAQLEEHRRIVTAASKRNAALMRRRLDRHLRDAERRLRTTVEPATPRRRR